MSETLLGVLIGGLLSGLGTWLTLLLQQTKWRTELRITHLKEKRAHLEVACQRILDALPKAMANNSYPISLLSEIDFLMPESVSAAFETLMHDKEKNEQSLKGHHYRIARAMKKELRSIDEEIERACTGKKA